MEGSGVVKQTSDWISEAIQITIQIQEFLKGFTIFLKYRERETMTLEPWRRLPL